MQRRLLQSKSLRLVVCCLLVTASGCIVTSSRPLSNEKTSKLDERLVGRWAIKNDQKKNPIEVRRLEGAENTLEWVDEAGKKGVIFTTQIGEKRYVSYADDKQTTYFIVRYEVAKDGNSVHVFLMDPDTIADAISKRNLGGIVETKPAAAVQAKRGFQRITITDNLLGMKRFFQKHADKAFVGKNELAFTFEKL